MAPKRKKPGSGRMDAALDQMSNNYGFSRPLVRKTVTKLLKLYGEEWIFIEDNGYRILIDVILEEQETSEANNQSKDESSLHDNPGKEMVTEDHSNEVAAEGASSTNNKKSNEKLHLPIEGVSNAKCVVDDVLDKNVAYSKCSCDAADKPVNVPNLKHKPCYGWISDDDSDKEIVFVKL
uniref:probable inactive histone-lysine N-methyltransferase SUVR1 n=1 Tax=Erigeron canadensis TaxID=72917 RepID=UPI001CB98FD7|nr:probable inactive histone-lysine N-methyltransferase SUVR1 [Erigeron canadensis]